MPDELTEKEIATFRQEAERIEKQGPKKRTIRAPVAGGARTDVSEEDRGDAYTELTFLRGTADQARLDLHEAIAKWSKIIDVSDVAVWAGLPRRSDVYTIVNKLPRFRRKMRGE